MGNRKMSLSAATELVDDDLPDCRVNNMDPITLTLLSIMFSCIVAVWKF